MKHNWNSTLFESIFVWIIAIIFGGIVLQGPISVGIGSLVPHDSLLVKSWTEILLVIAALMAVTILIYKKQTSILRDKLLLLMIFYVLLHVVLLAVFRSTAGAILAGLIIDLRYILFFGVVYIAIKLFPERKDLFLKVVIAGALVVVGFGVLQITVLPKDILKYIGYNNNTIVPYLTVDLNNSFIRINSTLRGPNPVGAYAIIVLGIVAAAIVKGKVFKNKNHIQAISGILAAGGLAILWASYSRSAVIGAVIALILTFIIVYGKKLSKRAWGIIVLVAIALMLSLVAISLTKFGSNIFLHSNPNGGSSTKSDAGHLGSLESGVALLAKHPLGGGVGSTGSASLLGPSPLVIENQYLFIAHESGWLGLIVFIILFIAVLTRLWKKRRSWFSLGVFTSGLGLAFVGLVLPVWVDDTVSIIWWGLAALAIGAMYD